MATRFDDAFSPNVSYIYDLVNNSAERLGLDAEGQDEVFAHGHAAATADASCVQRVVAAAEAVATARVELHAAVEAARALGSSWDILGAAFGRAGLRISDVLGRASQ